MVQANELRIGNKILGIAAGILITVDMHFFNECYDDDTMLDWYMPITLTEDVLVNCGFEKVKSDYGPAETDDYTLGILYFDMANQSTKISGKYCLSFIPESLHQLQNLYFALTGSELIVNF